MIDLIFKPLIINNNFKTSLIIGENDNLNFKLTIDLFLKLNKIKNFEKTIIFNNQYQQFFQNNDFKYLIFEQLDLYSKNHIIQNISEKESLIIFEVKTYVDSKLIEELIKNTNLNFLIISKDSCVFINYSCGHDSRLRPSVTHVEKMLSQYNLTMCHKHSFETKLLLVVDVEM